MLLVFATRYDAVTERTHSIAGRLLDEAVALQIQTLALLDRKATAPEFADALTAAVQVIAFFTHAALSVISRN